MNIKEATIILLISLALFSCNNKAKKNVETVEVKEMVKPASEALDKASLLLDEAFEAHGGALYDNAHYTFVFRDMTYTFNNTNGYRYTRNGKDKNGDEIYDVLKNGTLTRTLNGKETTLSKKEADTYAASVNSVIYFATLPHKLYDKAVQKTYKGTTTIKGLAYDIMEVTFAQEGGGKDFDDQFHYWINSDTKIIDYIAYNYQVDGGGVRFRSAYNPRRVDGIHFQDYVNYKAPIGTALKDLPKYYEEGKLKELSRIETEEIRSLR
ncbi:DUF6503 family protein [Spongiimicrobium salis]|uniref:DUF6503 family protein n=1 Tax=Spongiimicrobium salis TaxID=1667022 RepID=UPI00374CE7C5